MDARAGLVGCRADVAPEGDQHVVAGAAGHCRRRALQRHGRAGPAMRHHGGETQVGQAEVVDEIIRRAADDANRDDAVDIFRRQARIGNGFERRFNLKLERGLGRAAHVHGFTDAGHTGFVAQTHLMLLVLTIWLIPSLRRTVERLLSTSRAPARQKPRFPGVSWKPRAHPSQETAAAWQAQRRSPGSLTTVC